MKDQKRQRGSTSEAGSKFNAQHSTLNSAGRFRADARNFQGETLFFDLRKIDKRNEW